VTKRRTLAAIGALLLASGSCKDSTAPDKALTIDLTVDGTPYYSVSDQPNGPPKILCTVNLTATARGNGTAGWSGAKALWFLGKNRTTPVDSTVNTVADIQDSFGGTGGISAGQTLHSSWYFYDFAPFEVTFSFSYTTDKGVYGTTSTHFLCGPSPAGAVIPTVSQITVPGTSGTLKPGDTVSVSYQEGSSSGVWMTDIQVTGAFIAEKYVGEHLATSVNGTVKFVAPQQIVPGIPVVAWVRPYDVALEGSQSSLTSQLTFTDTTPPYLTVPYGYTGQYAVGDTMTFGAQAYDDDLLGWFVWSLGSPASLRDSVEAIAGRAYEDFAATLVVRPEWVGTPAFSMYTRDAGGLMSKLVTSPPDSLRFYPVVNRPTTTPLSLSPTGIADDIAYDARRGLVYVGMPNDNQIAVFAPGTMAAQSPIALPGPPAGMDLSLSGDSLLVSVPSANAIEVIDLNHPSTAPSAIRLPVVDSVSALYPAYSFQPSGLRIAANGKAFVFLTHPTPNTNDQVVELDLTTGTQRFREDARYLASVFTAYWTRYVGRTNDRSRIYVLGGTAGIYDAASDSFSSPLDSPGYCTGVTFDAAGDKVASANKVVDQNLTVLATTFVHGMGACAAISADGATVYLLDGSGNLRSMALGTGQMLERIPLPLTPQRLFVDPNGKWILAFKTAAGAQVTRVDLP
jgi:hypothetical protein